MLWVVARYFAGFGCLLIIVPAVVVGCSGSDGQSGSGEEGASAGEAGSSGATGGSSGASAGGSDAGQAGNTSGTGGTSGSATGGTSGSSAGGTSGSDTGGTSGGGAGGMSRGGDGGSNAGRGGSSGAGGSSSTSCAVDDDCVVAQTYSTTGCCSRGCGFALNGDWVANEPCATADPMADPVPASCSTGCQLCPADPRCEPVHGAVCLRGTCTAVTSNGPCTTDDDCVLGIDYESTLGACCDCPLATSTETLEHDACIVPFGEPKPNGCETYPVDACVTAGCPITCAMPRTTCLNGRCGP